MGGSLDDSLQGQIGRDKRPFDDVSTAHTIVTAIEACGYSIDDTDAFVRRVKNIEYGLSAEIEFAALLRWLGACPFVHRLQQEPFADGASSKWLVPDLLAVFRNGGLTCSAAIEVKTTRQHALRLKPDYIAKLNAYAKLISQPLLLAWRPRNFGSWLLVDLNELQTSGLLDGELQYEDAVKNDLMSLLAGDYHVVPERGVGLFFEASRIGQKIETSDGYRATYRINSAEFRDSDGIAVNDVPDTVVWTIFANIEAHQIVTDNGFSQSFITSGGLTRAQDILRTAASFGLDDNQRIDWKAIGSNLNSVLRSEDLSGSLGEHFGSFIRYVFHQQPQATPSFVPEGWRLVPGTGSPGRRPI